MTLTDPYIVRTFSPSKEGLGWWDTRVLGKPLPVKRGQRRLWVTSDVPNYHQECGQAGPSPIRAQKHECAQTSCPPSSRYNPVTCQGQIQGQRWCDSEGMVSVLGDLPGHKREAGPSLAPYLCFPKRLSHLYLMAHLLSSGHQPDVLKKPCKTNRTTVTENPIVQWMKTKIKSRLKSQWEKTENRLVEQIQKRRQHQVLEHPSWLSRWNWKLSFLATKAKKEKTTSCNVYSVQRGKT